MSHLTLEEAKAYLKKDENGINLYDHLTEVILRLLVERPANSTELFEHLSTSLKQERYVEGKEKEILSPKDKEMNALQEKFCTQVLQLLKIQNEDGSAAETPAGVADVMDEANMLEWAGIGFTKSEFYRLSLSLQKVAVSQNTSSLRLWGKLHGYDMDFYVAEGELADPYEPEDLEAEEGANGLNKFTYWIMKDDGTYEWIQLPHVRRDQILGARALKRFIKSDLEGKVYGHPPFPGVEKNYIRAQIARINASTVLCPSDYFTLTDEGEIETPEEITPKTAEELSDLANWVHFSKEINTIYGRTIPMPAKTNDEGEEIPYPGEEFIPLLRSLSEDTEKTWRIERVPFHVTPAVGEMAIVKSLVWPGAISIGLGKKFVNFYVGNGCKYLKNVFHPSLPKTLRSGYGLGKDSTDETKLIFTNLQEQEDVLIDPTPPTEEEQEEEA